MKHLLLVVLLINSVVFSQNYTEYVTGNVNDLIVTPDSGVCLMGGASESDEAMVWFLNKANGGDILVLRTSGSDAYNNYFHSDLGITVNSVRTIVINNAAGALDAYVLDKVEKAEAIWFAGGDQYEYVNYFKNTTMETALNTFINTKQGVIGGTSAGMAILGSGYFDAENGTVTNAEALANPYNNKVSLGYNDFLSIPYLSNVITDTHYDNPDRRARHSVFLARYTQDNMQRSYGIACNEYTAVCIDSDGKAYVYGDYPNYEEHAFFIQTNCVTTDFSPENCSSGNPLTWNKNGEALKVFKVPGMPTGENFFDLSDWTTGNGGYWQNWSVDNGALVTNAANNPNCASLNTDNFERFNSAVFPNPFVDYIYIECNSTDYEVNCFDISGKAIAVQKLENKVSTVSLMPGIYFFEISVEGHSEIIKMVKK